jgi:UTP--glucose-1-phosphate uridylyltransferase
MPDARVRKALIPAAGRGTRFLPFTKAVPKELAPIVTTPTLELVVAEATRTGITDVLLVVNPEKSAINDYFSPHPDLESALEKKGDEKRLDWVRRPTSMATFAYTDQLDPRGLGHAVGCGENFAAGDPIAVLLPDDLIDERDQLLQKMIDVQAEHGGIVVALLDVPRSQIDKYGSVVLGADSRESDEVVTITDMVEKPPPDEAPSTLAIIGRYVLPGEIFAALHETDPGAGGEIQLTDAMKALCRSGMPTHGVVFRGRRYDTGDPLQYVTAVVQLAARHPEIGADFRAWLREYEPEDG